MQTIQPQQILLPKKVYIGDTAELRCTFNSPNQHLRELVAGGIAELPLVSQDQASQNDYEIEKLSIAPAGVDFYQFTITFVPWKTGELTFPPMEIEGSDLILEFQPLQIVSLISTDPANATSLRDSTAPLLLPGTAYKLYGSLAVFILLLILLIRLIVIRKSLLFYINQKRLLKKYKKNKKLTLKMLRQLLDKKKKGAEAEEDTDNLDQLQAESLQKIIRSYLEVRFDYPFTRTVTSEMMKGWQAAGYGILSEVKEEAFGEIVSCFIRTDFIRYSKNGSFSEGELEELIKKLSNQIELLESDEEEKSEAEAQSHVQTASQAQSNTHSQGDSNA